MKATDLKIGDEVMVSARNIHTILSVERLTDKQVVLNNDLRIWKRDGSLVGSSDMWDIRTVKLDVTDKDRTVVAIQNKQRFLKRILTNIEIPKTIDELNKVIKCLKPFVKIKK